MKENERSKTKEEDHLKKTFTEFFFMFSSFSTETTVLK